MKNAWRSMHFGGWRDLMSRRRDCVFDDGFLRAELELLGAGRGDLLNVGFGMYSVISLRTAILVRPLTCTYLTSRRTPGRYFVNASVVSYMWLSASKMGKSSRRDTRPLLFRRIGRRAGTTEAVVARVTEWYSNVAAEAADPSSPHIAGSDTDHVDRRTPVDSIIRSGLGRARLPRLSNRSGVGIGNGAHGARSAVP